MTKQEFQSLTNVTVTDEEYKSIEQMYYACFNMDKREFCAAWKKQHGSLTDSLMSRVRYLEDQVCQLKTEDHLTDETAKSLIDIIEEKDFAYIRDMVILEKGTKWYLNYKLDEGYTLTEYDKKELIKLLQKC